MFFITDPWSFALLLGQDEAHRVRSPARAFKERICRLSAVVEPHRRGTCCHSNNLYDHSTIHITRHGLVISIFCVHSTVHRHCTRCMMTQPHILCDADPFALLCSRPALPGGTEQIPRAASADALQPRADTVLPVKGGAGCAGRYGRKALYDGRVDVIAFKTTLHIVFSLIFPKDCCSWICRREPAHFGRMRKEFGQRKEVPWCRTWDNWVDECSIRAAAKELELEFLDRKSVV